MDVDEGRHRLRQLLAGKDVFYGELDDVLDATGIDEATLRELALPGSNPIGVGISPRGGVIVVDADVDPGLRSLIDLIVYREHDDSHVMLAELADGALQGRPDQARTAAGILEYEIGVLVRMSAQRT